MNKLTLRSIAFSIALLAGCGDGGSSAPPEVENSIRTLVGHVAEYQADPKKFASCFEDGSIPDEAARKKLKGLMARVDRATIDEGGETATVSVLFEVLQTGEQLGPVQWTLVKSGDQWKVKSLAVP